MPPDGMQIAWIVFIKILAMFVVLLAGFVARRRGLLDAGIVQALSRLTTDLVFPALVVSQLVDLVDAATFRHSLGIFALGVAILAGGGLAAHALGRLILRPAERRDGSFLMAVPNWIFMPLPIVQALYGGAGVHALLLINVAMQVLLWTGGVWMLDRSARDAHPWHALRGNRGLQATFLAIGLGVVLPAASAMPEAVQPAVRLGRALLDGIGMIGSLTVPLILLTVGGQLAGVERPGRPDRLTATIVAGRLIVLPVLSAAVLTGARLLGWGDETTLSVALIIVCMPTAVMCGAFLDRYGGNTGLGARIIFGSTLFSIGSVPLLVAAVQRIWTLMGPGR